MSQNYYKLYIDSVIQLAETLVIKSEMSADLINVYISNYYGAEALGNGDKTTWKYYLNISGEYHSTDKVIFITSLDTLEKIAFTKANLSIHKATAQAYQYGTRFYRELVTNNPNQDQLILGILYPVPIADAIAASDGSILSYKPDLVETNEYSLIEKIGIWINGFRIRWDNQQFGVSDNLYPAAHLGVLYLNLVPVILNLRLKAAKTNEAHSFHVREYLASHGMLDVYLDTLTSKQALFLYRNINYIQRNAGSRDTFGWLVEKLLTDRGLPIAEYTMKHNDVGIFENIVPTVSFRKKPINLLTSTQNKTLFTLDEILNKEQDIAPGNVEYSAQHKTNILNNFQSSLSSVVATKLLESSITDYTDATPYTFQSIILNHWGYLASKNLFVSYLTFKNPDSGSDITLQASDAFVLMYYCIAKAIGSNIDKVPSFVAQRILKSPMASISDIMKVADSNLVTVAEAASIQSKQTIIGPLTSFQSFYDKCREIFTGSQKQLGLVSLQEDSYKRAITQNMVNQMFFDTNIHFANEGMLFSDWLITKELTIDALSVTSLVNLYVNIFEAGTGTNLNNISTLGAVQKSMISLLGMLSSYSIQFLSELNESNIRVLNWAVIRAKLVSAGISTEIPIGLPMVDILNSSASVNYLTSTIDANSPLVSITEKIVVGTKYLVNAGIDTTYTGSTSELTSRNILVGSMRVVTTYQTDSNLGYVEESFPGYGNLISIPSDYLILMKDMYCNCFEPIVYLKINLTDLISESILTSASGVYGFSTNPISVVANAFALLKPVGDAGTLSNNSNTIVFEQFRLNGTISDVGSLNNNYSNLTTSMFTYSPAIILTSGINNLYNTVVTTGFTKTEDVVSVNGFITNVSVNGSLVTSGFTNTGNIVDVNGFITNVSFTG